MIENFALEKEYIGIFLGSLIHPENIQLIEEIGATLSVNNSIQFTFHSITDVITITIMYYDSYFRVNVFRFRDAEDDGSLDTFTFDSFKQVKDLIEYHRINYAIFDIDKNFYSTCFFINQLINLKKTKELFQDEILKLNQRKKLASMILEMKALPGGDDYRKANKRWKRTNKC
jgi:hypothetical protein